MVRLQTAIRGCSALACLALAWVAAPALSSQPYMPGAVDFEQPLGPVRAAGALPNGEAGPLEPSAPAADRSASARP